MVIPELIHTFLGPQTYNIILLFLNIVFADLLYQIYLHMILHTFQIQQLISTPKSAVDIAHRESSKERL